MSDTQVNNSETDIIDLFSYIKNISDYNPSPKISRPKC